MTDISTFGRRILAPFRRPPRVNDAASLRDFLDRHTAFIAQKCVVEYSRARAGTNWSKLFKEPAFREALATSRWTSFGILLGDVTEMVGGALRTHDAGRSDLDGLAGALGAIAGEVTSSYPPPPGNTVEFWADVATKVTARIHAAHLAPPRPVNEIPVGSARQIYDALPIHAGVRGEDAEMIQNNLRFNLCRSYETFIDTADQDLVLLDLLDIATVRQDDDSR